MKYTKEFYDFVMEREAIRVRRTAGMPQPEWTQDPILREFKFTNVKRAHDRTTSELRDTFYMPAMNAGIVTAPEMLLNCAMARFFGLTGTVLEIGWLKEWNSEAEDHIHAVVESRNKRKAKVFTSAYIVPNCGDTAPKHEVVCKVLGDVWTFGMSYFGPHTPNDWQPLIKQMCAAIRGMGSFMAKEVVLDYILVTDWTPGDWLTWTPIGPGARRGAARAYYGGPITTLPGEATALEWTRQLYDARDDHWVAPSVEYGGHTHTSNIVIELSDVQFQLCEFDKYLRAKTGDGRPKARFIPTH